MFQWLRNITPQRSPGRVVGQERTVLGQVAQQIRLFHDPPDRLLLVFQERFNARFQLTDTAQDGFQEAGDGRVGQAR